MSGRSSPSCGGADLISVVEFAGSEVLDAFLPSAGGPSRLPGDYVYSNQRLPYSQSGQWGYVRVLPVRRYAIAASRWRRCRNEERIG